jgi:hypothetical protein
MLFFIKIVIGCVTAMKMRLRTLLHSRRSQANAVGSYAKSMKGVIPARAKKEHVLHNSVCRFYREEEPAAVIVYHSDVMWPYYIWRQPSVLRPRRKPNMPRKPLATTTPIKLPSCKESPTLQSTSPGCTTQVAWSVNVPIPYVLRVTLYEYLCPGRN